MDPAAVMTITHSVRTVHFYTLSHYLASCMSTALTGFVIKSNIVTGVYLHPIMLVVSILILFSALGYRSTPTAIFWSALTDLIF